MFPFGPGGRVPHRARPSVRSVLTEKCRQAYVPLDEGSPWNHSGGDSPPATLGYGTSGRGWLRSGGIKVDRDTYTFVVSGVEGEGRRETFVRKGVGIHGTDGLSSTEELWRDETRGSPGREDGGPVCREPTPTSREPTRKEQPKRRPRHFLPVG